jgi:transcriptional regulator with XRE-family HTH domain
MNNPDHPTLTELRNERGMSLEEAAAIINSTPGVLEMWEQGKAANPIPLDRVRTLCKALGARPDEVRIPRLRVLLTHDAWCTIEALSSGNIIWKAQINSRETDDRRLKAVAEDSGSWRIRGSSPHLALDQFVDQLRLELDKAYTA